MARQPQQKRKILILRELLLRRSDEQHPVTMQQILQALEQEGVSAERKSIYSDLEALRDQGMDIIQTREGTQTGYCVVSRDFELPELRLRVDAVQSSRFLTQHKSLELIRKLEQLTSVHEAKMLHRSVSVAQRIKSMNESIYYNVDEIQTAMSENRQISFRYFDYDVTRERVWRRNGGRYQCSPYGLHWDNQNYYLIAYDEAADGLRHYRVDRMAEIRACEEARTGDPAYRSLDVAAYVGPVFSMYAGERTKVLLRLRRHLVGAVIDRFGKEVPLTPDGPDWFTTRVDVALSPQFFGWLCGFGADAKLLHPAAAAEQYRQHLQAALARCEEAADGSPRL